VVDRLSLAAVELLAKWSRDEPRQCREWHRDPSLRARLVQADGPALRRLGYAVGEDSVLGGESTDRVQHRPAAGQAPDREQDRALSAVDCVGHLLERHLRIRVRGERYISIWLAVAVGREPLSRQGGLEKR